MNSLPSDTFTRLLRIERERQRISQAELARRMAGTLGTNVDPTAVTRIEQQTRAVRLDEAVAMATALGVPLAALLAEDQVGENEALKQRYLVELAAAQRQWEQSRQEIGRLTSLIQSLSVPRSGSVDQEDH
ncbi:helix-turn-helix domain-containing protein [Arthrobacter bambusae]|uniref:Transcriptional regulator with XRE-family HTH domain n=1 Tax=Arthrobacter bambusae TaxID=1338426 RepID=A0AAW8D2Y1_9MICC|nr:helix-turn-helix transcriptional regulator [Arthrobacter bambusae]MDP9903251.1 transcriptional regulator with XRE-family HTH domain [Arthrobacter bambusae]MDQ0128755.1 transcriptional regulator with XRE-family HTH domain [Arthrobacter bambusae]MDQ0180096.1 transcriptional regulator with XRE-family HTH domain [Arthrobacter bambusae]